MKGYGLKTSLTFDSAHRLPHHKGQCKNLHGHTWKLLIEIKEASLTDDGFIIDFGIIKDLIKKRYDHKLLVSEDDTALLNVAATLGCNYLVTKTYTTAEYIAKDMAEFLKASFLELGVKSCQVELELFETPNNSVKISFFYCV